MNTGKSGVVLSSTEGLQFGHEEDRRSGAIVKGSGNKELYISFDFCYYAF